MNKIIKGKKVKSKLGLKFGVSKIAILTVFSLALPIIVTHISGNKFFLIALSTLPLIIIIFSFIVKLIFGKKASIELSDHDVVFRNCVINEGSKMSMYHGEMRVNINDIILINNSVVNTGVDTGIVKTAGQTQQTLSISLKSLNCINIDPDLFNFSEISALTYALNQYSIASKTTQQPNSVDYYYDQYMQQIGQQQQMMQQYLSQQGFGMFKNKLMIILFAIIAILGVAFSMWQKLK